MDDKSLPYVPAAEASTDVITFNRPRVSVHGGRIQITENKPSGDTVVIKFSDLNSAFVCGTALMERSIEQSEEVSKPPTGK